jgi:hypothetical protein
MKIKQFNERVIHLIILSGQILTTKESRSKSLSISRVNEELFFQFRTSSLSFISNLYGEEHPFYKDFINNVVSLDPSDTEKGRGILKSIKDEIDNGWLNSLKGIVSAEIFSNFLEMADHLLKEKYKDPAAVMIGSVLEEHLRQLCIKNSIAVSDSKSGKLKKTQLLNSDLTNQGVYNVLDQKSVTAWLDLRNKAAHGNYLEYSQTQVEQMLNGVTEFIARNAI